MRNKLTTHQESYTCASKRMKPRRRSPARTGETSRGQYGTTGDPRARVGAAWSGTDANRYTGREHGPSRSHASKNSRDRSRRAIGEQDSRSECSVRTRQTGFHDSLCVLCRSLLGVACCFARRGPGRRITSPTSPRRRAFTLFTTTAHSVRNIFRRLSVQAARSLTTTTMAILTSSSSTAETGLAIRRRASTTPKLYHNNATAHSPTSRQGWPRDSLYGLGVAVGDYDNDGYDDLFITALGQNHLFHNNRQRDFHRCDEAGRTCGDRTS